MTKAKKKRLKKQQNFEYSLKFETRFWKYNLILTDEEILRIDKEDHRNYSGGTSYNKEGFKNTPLINQLEEMLRDGIDKEEIEIKIKYYLKKEIDKIKPVQKLGLKG